MPRDYRITKISEQAPREWTGQYGTTYYIKVMLEGHDKPVEIGKKKLNSLAVGDIVYGDVTPTNFLTDKFTGAQKGFDNAGATQDLTPLQSKLDAIHGDIKLALSFLRQLQKEEPARVTPSDDEPFPGDEDRPPELDTVIMDIGDEPINLDDIPF